MYFTVMRCETEMSLFIPVINMSAECALQTSLLVRVWMHVCGLPVIPSAMQQSKLNRASLYSGLISRLDGSHSSLDVLVTHVD